MNISEFMPFLFLVEFIVFIFGTAIGSFLSACVYRMRRRETLLGRSHCSNCGYKLGFFDLFPILSFLCLRGKCKKCETPIDREYFLTEIATGAVFLFSFLFRWSGAGNANDFSFVILRDWLFLSGLIFIFIYDFKYQEIPDAVSIPLAICLFAVNLFLGADWKNLLLAVGAGGGFFILQYLVSRGKWVGDGDIRMGALLGAGLGWPFVVFAVFIAYILGGIVSAWLLISRRKKMQSRIAFGTFLALGGFVAMYWGEKVIIWYLTL
jgi:prepilin signal peptidase PulO-like enzyme (type II secretory pathway)